MDEDAERLRLLQHFSDGQLARFEAFRRSGLKASRVKKVMGTVYPSTIPHTMAIVMAGIAKVFVGELVESAILIQNELGQGAGLNDEAQGIPLLPSHIRTAYRRIKARGSVPPSTLTYSAAAEPSRARLIG